MTPILGFFETCSLFQTEEDEEVSSVENSRETSRLSSNVQLPRFSSNVAQDGRSVEIVSIDGDESTGAYSTRLPSAKSNLSNRKSKVDADAAAEEYPEDMGGGDGDFSSDFSVGLRMSDNPMATIRMSSNPTSNQAAPTALEDDIEELKDANGNMYFHDRQSGSTAWTRDEVCVTLSLL